MDAGTNSNTSCEDSFRLTEPVRQTVPIVVSSPHSGTCYPASFIEQSALDAETLRRSEDTFVDELFSSAPKSGAPLLSAVCARAYVDLNREPYELDPEMFSGSLPEYVNTGSSRVAAGLGTIARDVSEGTEIYRGKLTFSEARKRIETIYRPYHERLSSLIEGTVSNFGYCLLIDAHSMPTMDSTSADIVLGDRHGLSCSPVLTSSVEYFLRRKGLSVAKNKPYAGGHTTSFYGSPHKGIHALQIEVARKLYMDEVSHTPLRSLGKLGSVMGKLLLDIAALPPELFIPLSK